MSDLVTSVVDASIETTHELTAPISMRWPPALLARADAVAAAAGAGFNRSLVLRMACERGMAAVELALGKPSADG